MWRQQSCLLARLVDITDTRIIHILNYIKDEIDKLVHSKIHGDPGMIVGMSLIEFNVLLM